MSTKIQVTDGALIPEKGERGLFSAWRISFFGAIAILILLPVLWPNPYLDVLRRIFPEGLINTLKVTLLSITFSLLVGLVIGLGRISRNVIISRLSTIYVEVIRGIPLLVQLLYIYFVLGRFLKFTDIWSAVIAMSICYGAYMGEIFRAGIQAIPKGQMEAALSIGMSRWQALRYIILPQTIKVVLPPVGNEFIALLKDSSLVSTISVTDILRSGKEYTASTFNYFAGYTIVALLYLVMTLFLSRVVAWLEERLDTRGTPSKD